jgi:hypothetical protein
MSPLEENQKRKKSLIQMKHFGKLKLLPPLQQGTRIWRDNLGTEEAGREVVVMPLRKHKRWLKLKRRLNLSLEGEKAKKKI